MSTQEILAELPSLSAEDRERIAGALRDLETERQAALPPTQEQRTAGLHAGAWTVAEDFDEPLPDEFWFGKEA